MTSAPPPDNLKYTAWYDQWLKCPAGDPARAGFAAGWDAGRAAERERLRDRVYSCQVAVHLPHVGEHAAAVLMSDLIAIFAEGASS